MCICKYFDRMRDDPEGGESMTDEARQGVEFFREKLRETGVSEAVVADAVTGLGSISVGTKLHSAHLEDLAWVVERALYMQDARSVTLKVKRGEDEHI